MYMMKFRLLSIALGMALTILATPFGIMAASPDIVRDESSPLDHRVEQLVGILDGSIQPGDYFTDSFLASVPPIQWTAITTSLTAQYGRPLGLVKVDRKSDNGAMVEIAYEKAIARLEMTISASPPNKVNSLRITGFAEPDDNIEKIKASFSALPGQSGFIVEKLGVDDGDEGHAILAAHNMDSQFAIGSTFKLYILAELAAQIDAGERSWSDVVPLSHRSFSSGATQNWPENSPATLETLAIQMISVSDNSATDTLMHVLGRSAIERKLATIGHGDPDRMLPFLTTFEAFALKSPENEDLRNRYLTADEAGQRAIVENEQQDFNISVAEFSIFGGGPAFIDRIEWFASPVDITGLLDNIRRGGSERLRQIMAVNPGLPSSSATKWKYVGYKGGSEPGVISMSFLLQAPSGQWFAISGSWNNAKEVVNNNAFALLMARLADAFAE